MRVAPEAAGRALGGGGSLGLARALNRARPDTCVQGPPPRRRPEGGGAIRPGKLECRDMWRSRQQWALGAWSSSEPEPTPKAAGSEGGRFRRWPLHSPQHEPAAWPRGWDAPDPAPRRLGGPHVYG